MSTALTIGIVAAALIVALIVYRSIGRSLRATCTHH